MKFLTCYLIVLSFQKLSYAQSLPAFLSEKLQKTFSGQCPTPDALQVFRSTQSCYRYLPPSNEIEDDLFFKNLIKIKRDKINCSLQNLENLVSSGDAEERMRIAKSFKSRIPKLRELWKRKSQLIEGQGNEPGFNEAQKIQQRAKNKQELLKVENAIQQIRSSVWMAGTKSVQNFLDKAIQMDTRYDEVFVTAFLDKSKGDFNYLLSDVKNETEGDLSKLNTIDSIPDSMKVELFSDSLLVGALQAGTNSQIWPGLHCRMDARYGAGRQKLKDAEIAMVSAALMVTPIGFGAAASAGLLSASAARIFGIASLTGISGVQIAKTYETKCKSKVGQKFKDYDSCSRYTPDETTWNHVESDCALEIALASLDLPFAEIAMALPAFKIAGKVLDKGQLVKVTSKATHGTDSSVLVGRYDPLRNDDGLGIFLKDETGKVDVGTMEYHIRGKNNSTMYIDWIEIASDHRGKGYSDILLKKALDENPQVKVVTSEMNDVNLEVFVENFELTKNMQTALQQTPIYKSLSKIGIKTAKPIVQIIQNVSGQDSKMYGFWIELK